MIDVVVNDKLFQQKHIINIKIYLYVHTLSIKILQLFYGYWLWRWSNIKTVNIVFIKPYLFSLVTPD